MLAKNLIIYKFSKLYHILKEIELDLNFNIHPTTKDINKFKNENAVINAVKNLVLTNHYDRPFQPDIGSNLKRLLFEQVDNVTAALIERDIETTITNFEPRVDLKDVVASGSPDENGYNVQITFFLIKQAPGGPFDAEKAVSPQVLKNLNAAYNLDASQWEQYTDYMTGIVQGDFGPSFRYPGRSVTEMILTGLPVTFELAIYAILIALVIGVFSGVLAALKRNTALDFIPMAIAMIGICVPTFLMGPLLVLIFGINLELLPVSGWNQIPGDKILPSLTLCEVTGPSER